MNTQKKKISLRGSLAADIARQLKAPALEVDLIRTLGIVLGEDPNSLVFKSEEGMLLVGKRADLGKYLPDW